MASESKELGLDADQQPEKDAIRYFSPHCDYSCSSPNNWWTSTEPRPPSYSAKEPILTDDDVSGTIERTLDILNPKLRVLSLKIHGILFVVV